MGQYHRRLWQKIEGLPGNGSGGIFQLVSDVHDGLKCDLNITGKTLLDHGQCIANHDHWLIDQIH